MLQFDPQKYSYASHRNIVYAKKGMACSTSPIASQVGLDIMKAGGNAMDAAVAMATTLPLVEPTGNGLGSDCLALVWSAKDSTLSGLGGPGVAPTGANLPTGLKKYSAPDGALTAAGGAFTWTIAAATHGISDPTSVQLFESATGAMVMADITTSATDVTIVINDTTGAGTLTANTYRVVIVG